MGKFLKITEVASILRITPITAQRLIKREGLGVKVGGSVRINEDELKAYLERQKIIKQ